MHLGFDAKRLFNNFTGLGNYSRTLLKNLAEEAPEHHYFLYSPKAAPHEETQYFFQHPGFEIVQPTSFRKIGWRTMGMMKDLQYNQIDLYHGLSHELPVGIRNSGIRSVVTIHDLIYRHYPNQYGQVDNWIYDKKFKSACSNADKIVAISEATKRDIQHFFGTTADKIEVIYQSCDERFLLERPNSVIEEIKDKYALSEQYSLYVGSLIPRKNLLGIIEALAQLPPSLQHPLVIVGGGGKQYKQQVLKRAIDLGIQDLLLFRAVSFADLPIVYQGASVFLYPSVYEGFGIPVIEALNSGIPVITSNRSSLPEAAGPDSYLINPDEPAEIADAWEKVLTDEELRNNMISSGHKYAQNFLASNVTPQMLALYRQLK